jgi:parallel beta-helix repeat protein
VNQANNIFANKTYNSVAWEGFFEEYLLSNPLTDSLHFYLCHPLFWWFDKETRQNLEEGIISSLFNNIGNIMNTYSSNLSETLSHDPDILQTLAKSHAFLDQICTIGTVNVTFHTNIFGFYSNLTESYPEFLRSNITFNPAEEPYIATLRAQAYATFEDALPLSTQVKQQIAESTALSGLYLEIWNDFGTIVMDNNGLDQEQLEAIHKTLQNIPSKLHSLRMITQNDLLGNVDEKYLYVYCSAIINILDVEIGTYEENQFPEDISPAYSDFFHMILVHEINHIVDAYYISSNATFSDRKLSLIEGAGDPHMNYLRSMLPDGFFTQYPQEFFASISNQWFCDSFHTLELGLARLEQNYIEPINQFLYFADIYSQGLNTTVFYRLDSAGNITKTIVPLTRDENGHINSLEFNSTRYSFNVDYEGKVLPHESTIWIMADGSIDPLEAAISSGDNITYTLTTNIYKPIIVERGNITIDGNGFTIQGSTIRWGIYLQGTKNVTIKNVEIEQFAYGILLDRSTYTNIEENTIVSNSYGLGVYTKSCNNTISDNNITSNDRHGIILEGSSNKISENNLANSTIGVEARFCSYNAIYENNVNNNSRYGILLSYSSYNTISGNRILWNSLDGVLLESASHNTLNQNKLELNSWYGIRLYNSSDYNTISHNNVAGNGAHGILLDACSYNTLTGNNITANNWYGIHFWHSSNYNNIVANNMTNNDYGIWLLGSSYNTISQNNIVNNSVHGILLDSCFYNILTRNYIAANNYYGMYFWHASNYNIVIENNVTSNDYVIWLLDSVNNTFYHNNFVNNEYQVLISPSGLINFWDNGYPSGGNYWSNYNGDDLYWGQYQNMTGSDGIGDMPYIIDGNNKDNYPLIDPWNPFQGDVNRDSKVDGKDVAVVAKAYNTKPADPKWDQRADINKDLKVDGKDIAIVAKYYGKTYP